MLIARVRFSEIHIYWPCNYLLKMLIIFVQLLITPPVGYLWYGKLLNHVFPEALSIEVLLQKVLIHIFIARRLYSDIDSFTKHLSLFVGGFVLNSLQWLIITFPTVQLNHIRNLYAKALLTE